ncbi:MAG TPA: chromosome segregation protein SMC, partial [Devosia sp.]|nr:chromosome segregation protein SMC [Devosia sp.]
MIFQRLRLSGFKSFCDPVDLHLEPGLTGVVGPNGCGKSNLMEAMRWVMGESSYKAMRASGMDDVIFSGSAGRPGRNFAEVTLFLDNSDRTAPPAFNDADMLEVSRRIERENGSVYRVNGKDVRARDVQLLFADASTGAHSPALVRQGQIGELVNAKPVKRRALLEEAAGISGLYSRRHEAELRLKGAENNLERVDDIIAQVEGQVETLKRQSRQAVRYRNISGDIRRAEAALFHVRWVASRVAEKEAQAVQARLITQLAEAKHQELESRKALETAEAALVPLREEEARAAAAVQRLKILREQLESEIERMGAQQQDLNRRLKQVSDDVERESRLVQDSEQALEQYEAERAALMAETEDSREGLDALKERFATSRALLEEKEKTFRAATARLAQVRADRAQAQRLADDARKRAERLTIQIADVDAEAQKLGEQLDQDAVIGQRMAELAAAKEASMQAEEAAMSAEADVQAAQGALEKSRPNLRELAEQTSRLEAEAETLARVLNIGDNELWPAIVDALEVTPGYEVALGAALGDDLEASSDDGAPIHWARPGNGDNDPSLPTAVTPLSRFVDGVDSLKRTLDQIGIVDAERGAELMLQLETGQRLVSLQG